MDNLNTASRYMSKLLRHHPEDLVMDNDGYVEVSQLLSKLKISKEDLDWIVSNNDKKRFGYNQSETAIRASQGHSSKMSVDVKMVEAPLVQVLYHGTAKNNIDSIMKNGLIPKSRKHVHLSSDPETARKVALRHSKDIIILKINSAKMRADNLKIYISDNGVYLTASVNPSYLTT